MECFCGLSPPSRNFLIGGSYGSPNSLVSTSLWSPQPLLPLISDFLPNRGSCQRHQILILDHWKNRREQEPRKGLAEAEHTRTEYITTKNITEASVILAWEIKQEREIWELPSEEQHYSNTERKEERLGRWNKCSKILLNLGDVYIRRWLNFFKIKEGKEEKEEGREGGEEMPAVGKLTY